MTTNDDFKSLLEILNGKQRVLLVTHARPDGDALGTVAAMSMALRKKAITSRLLLFNPPPEKYDFLMKESRIDAFDIAKGWPADVDLKSFDRLLVMDTGTWSQLPGLKEIIAGWSGTKLVVDHHLTQEDWADFKLVDTHAAAAGEILAELLDRWEVTIDREIATALYLAISTDTGWFQFSNTGPQTLRLAARLMEACVDTERIYRLAFQNERPQRLSLMAVALQSLELLAANRLAVMSVSNADFKRANADSSDTENLINLPLQVGSVEVSVFLAESPDGGPLRVSLRSKGGVDVAAFAHKFSNGNGGGHARAAGLKVLGTLAEVRGRLSAALIDVLAKH